jgi:predicted ATPase/DNA-binding SARP family transcriptional activator
LVNGNPLPRLRTRRGEWLLALLILRSGHEVDRAWLAGTLWPDSTEAQALTNLRVSLADLRRALGSEAGRLRSPTPRTVSLDLTGADVDLLTFDAALTRRDPASLDTAVTLYRGPLLEPCAEEWVFQERQVRERDYLEALETLAGDVRRAGDLTTAERHLRRVAAVDPLRESSQRELMRLLGCAGNYAAACQTYRDLRTRLHREVNAEPDPETTALYHQIRAEARAKAVPGARVDRSRRLVAPRPGSVPGSDSNIPDGAPRHNLPVPPTALIGRENELCVLRDLLRGEGARLVTLTGPGGIGKTRLALQVAEELSDAYRDGVSFVSLAPIRDCELVASTIAQTLGLREGGDLPPREQLREYLRDRRTLLLLDNFEQVGEAAPLVAELLANSPRLAVLVTSRERLRLQAEREFAVPPLAVPNGDQRATTNERMPAGGPDLVARLSQYPAVELFVERAVAARADFRLTHENAPAVAEICRRLEGLPLAIVLAAARVKLFSPEALLARLGSRLGLLTGGARDLPARQQTLRDTIAWSYDLLSEEEKALFRRLSVFAGGFTLEAAETVCASSVDRITSLLDKSLLREEEGDDEPRLGMLETIREYAAERLEESGEGGAIRRAHASFFMAFVEAAWSGEGESGPLWGPEQKQAFDRLEREHDNLRAALNWSHGEPGEIETELRLLASAWTLWWMRGYMSEGRRWLESALARDEPMGPRAAWARIGVLRGAGLLASFQGDSEGHGTRMEECLAQARAIQHPEGIAWGLFALGRDNRQAGDLQTARSQFEEALDGMRAVGHRGATGDILMSLAGLCREQGDEVRARALHEEGLAQMVASGRPDYLGRAFAYRGGAAFRAGDYVLARSLFEKSLNASREVDQRFATGQTLHALARCARALGDRDEARALCSESLAISRAIGNRWLIALLLRELGQLALERDGAGASDLFRESLGITRDLGDQEGIAASLEGLAGAAAIGARMEDAARWFGAAAVLRQAISAPVPASECEEHERRVAAVKEALGEPAFRAAWAEGAAMPLEEAIRCALERDPSSRGQVDG